MGTTAFLIITDEPQSDAYFNAFPKEPIKPSGFTSVDKRVVLKNPDVVALLTAIARDNNENVLIVSHGFGGGLAVPLAVKTKTTLGTSELNTLNECASGNLKTADAAKRLDIPEAQVKAIKKAILDVRGRRVKGLILRSCLVGASPDTLNNLKELFGSASACGPDIFDSFGSLNIPAFATAKEIDDFVKQSGVQVDGVKPDRFAWKTSTRIVPNAIFADFQIKAESKQAVTDWVARHLPGTYRGSGPVPYHGLNIGDDIVFPLDKDYREHLKRVP